MLHRRSGEPASGTAGPGVIGVSFAFVSRQDSKGRLLAIGTPKPLPCANAATAPSQHCNRVSIIVYTLEDEQHLSNLLKQVLSSDNMNT